MARFGYLASGMEKTVRVVRKRRSMKQTISVRGRHQVVNIERGRFRHYMTDKAKRETGWGCLILWNIFWFGVLIGVIFMGRYI